MVTSQLMDYTLHLFSSAPLSCKKKLTWPELTLSYCTHFTRFAQRTPTGSRLTWPELSKRTHKLVALRPRAARLLTAPSWRHCRTPSRWQRAHVHWGRRVAMLGVPFTPWRRQRRRTPHPVPKHCRVHGGTTWRATSLPLKTKRSHGRRHVGCLHLRGVGG